MKMDLRKRARIFIILVLINVLSCRGLRINFSFSKQRHMKREGTVVVMDTQMGSIPGVIVDVVESSDEESLFKINEAQDVGQLLKSHKKCVLFAVPGAFTPTCNSCHLAGFVAKANDIKEKGVDAIYCLSVNDRFVMKAWADATPGLHESGIKLIADGNGAFTSSMGFVKDGTGSRMGLRSKRLAAVIENGVITAINIDEKGLQDTSADAILALLSTRV